MVRVLSGPEEGCDVAGSRSDDQRIDISDDLQALSWNVELYAACSGRCSGNEGPGIDREGRQCVTPLRSAESLTTKPATILASHERA
jgi:hypothetical protein